MPSRESDRVARGHVRDFVRAGVRAGLLGERELYDESVAAISAELPDLPAEETARQWIGDFRVELEAESRRWPATTDYDRLQAVFDALESAGIVVLQACEDHWAAKAVLERLDDEDRLPRGVAWFMPSDVWHAIDHGMLEVNLWHASTANVAPGDRLLDDVVAVFAEHGLPAHFDEGRIEVGAHWQRRPLLHPDSSAVAPRETDATSQTNRVR